MSHRHPATEQVLNLWQAGFKRQQIVDRLSGLRLTTNKVEGIIASARERHDPRAVLRSKAIPASRIMELHAQGMSAAEIAQQLDVSRTGVIKLIARELEKLPPGDKDGIPEVYSMPAYVPPPIRRRISALLEDQRMPELHRARTPASPGICERVPDPAALARAANRSPAVMSTRWSDGWEGADA